MKRAFEALLVCGLLAAAAFIPGAAHGVLSDTTPPTLVALAVDGGPYDVTSARQTVTGSATITDDLSGVNTGCVPGFVCFSPSQLMLASPSGRQTAFGMFVPHGGDAYTFAATIPQYAETGAWTVRSVFLVDNVGNSRSLSTGDLQAAGLPTSVTVTGISDTTPPTLTGLALDPGPYDISSSEQHVTGTMTVTDDLAGVNTTCVDGLCFTPTQIRFVSPSGRQIADSVVTPLGGDRYAVDATLRRYAETGTWNVQSVLLGDNVGNTRYLQRGDVEALGLPTSFDVVGTTDTAPPVLVADSLSPDAVDVTAGPATITVAMTITDDVSGVSVVCSGTGVCSSQTQLMLVSPSGRQTAWSLNGRALGGDEYAFDVPIAQYAEAGNWTIATVLLTDRAGNVAWLQGADLAARGLQLTVAVSKIVSGTTGDGGTFSSGTTSPSDPLQASITTPTGGPVTVRVTPVTQPLPVGWNAIGQQLTIEAPAATAAAPLRLAFDVDRTVVPPSGVASLDVFRNGAVVPDCTAADGTATPDPCVAARSTTAGGGAELVVLSSHASRWNVAARTNRDPVCTAVAAAPATLWPPNGRLVPITLAGATDPDGDTLTYRIGPVTASEPAQGDVVAAADGTVSVRAARLGSGGGRTYTIPFAVTDGKGGTCSGAATVTVPHDRGR